MHELIRNWRKCQTQNPPFIFPGDEVLLERQWSQYVTRINSFDAYTKSELFGRKPDRSVHVNLIPTPYIGNLVTADIFILMMNPGLAHSDHYSERQSEDFRQALISNLYQEALDKMYPFVDLNPKFAWVAGFQYWQGKLHRVIEIVQSDRKISHQQALSILAKRIACVEHMPYHSPDLRLPARLTVQLASPKAVVSYVHEVIVPKAEHGDAVVIVARKSRSWGLDKFVGHKNFVFYEGAESRSVHLTPESPGGRAIMTRFGI